MTIIARVQKSLSIILSSEFIALDEVNKNWYTYINNDIFKRSYVNTHFC